MSVFNYFECRDEINSYEIENELNKNMIFIILVCLPPLRGDSILVQFLFRIQNPVKSFYETEV